MTAPNLSWTVAEDKRLLDLSASGMDPIDIAGEMCRSHQAIKSRLRRLRMTPEKRQAELAYGRNRERLRRIAEQTWSTGERRSRPERPVNDAAMLYRIAEAACLRPRDLTGLIMGDPPVGRSALDARR